MQILAISSNVTGWLARGMVHQLYRHWPQHPPVIVGGYDKPPLQDGVQFHKIGEWRDFPVNRWSDGLITFVNAVADEMFLLTFDDFWVLHPIDDAVIRLCEVAMIMNPDAARIDLTDDRLMSGGAVDFGRIMVDGTTVNLITTPAPVPYLFSYQPAIWRKSELLRYMRWGESPAESEIRGGNRMNESKALVLGTREVPFKIKIMQQHGALHLDDPGYQAPGTALLPEDRAELERLGYLRP